MWSKHSLLGMITSSLGKPAYEVVDVCDVPGPAPVIQIGIRETRKGFTNPGLHQEVVDLIRSEESIAVLGYLTEKNRIVVNVMLKNDESTHDEQEPTVTAPEVEAE